MDGGEGLANGRVNETLCQAVTIGCGQIVASPAQPGWCGHNLHHLSSSGLLQPRFLSGCGTDGRSRAQGPAELQPGASQGILFQLSGLSRAARHRREFRAGCPFWHVWDN